MPPRRASGIARASLDTMDELGLESWERELAAWRRRVSRCDPSPALLEELREAAEEIDAVRTLVRAKVAVTGERVLRHFARLRALWEYLQPDHAGVNEPSQAS